MVPADSRRIPRVLRYSGYHYASSVSGTQLSCSMAALSSAFPSPLSCNLVVLQPRGCRNTRGFGLFPRSLATTGESFLFSFPAGTKMFPVPALASVIGQMMSLQDIGLSYRRSAGQGSFAPHRGFSQLITSFIASESLGIHHVPLSTSFPSATLLLLRIILLALASYCYWVCTTCQRSSSFN